MPDVPFVFLLVGISTGSMVALQSAAWREYRIALNHFLVENKVPGSPRFGSYSVAIVMMMVIVVSSVMVWKYCRPGQ